MRHRYFVRTQYGVIKIKSLSYIMKNMHYLSAGRTVISIAHHRLNSIRHADKICVINEGQMIEFDSHDNLLKLNGFYAQL